MAKFKPHSCLLAAAILAVSQSAAAVGLPDVSSAHSGKQLGQKANFTDALIGGKSNLSLRLRYEDVSDDIPAASPLAGIEDADMLSVRTVLGYSTARYYGFYARLEFEATTRIGSDNAFTVGDDLTFPPGPVGSQVAKGHSLIADPENEEFNEAYIGWRSASSGCPNAPGGCNGGTTIKLGRQEIIFDNHRWVGNIVWRQNHQSYDAVRIDNTSIPNLSASYAYVTQVNRTFGQASPFDIWEMDNSHFVNVAYKFPIGKLAGYGYLLDFDDNPNTPFTEGASPVIYDSDTWGLRFVGKYPFNDAFALLYELEWANQDPTNDAPSTLSDNNYTNIEFGGAFKIAGKPVAIKVGQEVLEGNGVNAVQTNLATVHAFNGWADKFVGAPAGTATPAGGLEDTSIAVVINGLGGPSKLVFQYHDYQADTIIGGLDDYGDEWSALYAKPFTKNWLALVKYTDFSDGGQGFGFDTQKFWVLGQFKFDQ